MQFDHRLLATLTGLLALATVAVGLRRPNPPRLRLALLGGTIAAQYALGVATLLSVVAIPLAVAHQAVAVLALTAALFLLHRLRR